MANLDFSTTPFADFAYTKIFGTPDTAAHFAKVFGDNASLQRALSALQRGPALFFRDNVIAFDEDVAEHLFLSLKGWFVVAKFVKAALAVSYPFIFRRGSFRLERTETVAFN